MRRIRKRPKAPAKRGQDGRTAPENDPVDMEHSRVEDAARLRSIFLAAPVGIGVVSPEREMMQVNDRLCEMLGYPSEELLGKNARMIYATQEDFEYVGREKYRQIEERGTGAVETRWRRKDGRIIDVLLSSTPIDPSDRSKGVTFTALDITKSKRTEEDLRHERDRAQKYLDIAAVIVLALDVEGKVTLINRKGCEILGYEEEEMVGKRWFDHFLPERIRDDVSEISATMMKGEREGVSYNENPVVCKNGEERLIAWHNTVLEDERGTIMGTLSSGQDITESRRAEEELKSSERHYKSLIRNSGDAISVLNADFTFRWGSKSAARITGYTREETYGKDFTEFIHPDDIGDLREAAGFVLHNPEVPFEIVVRFRHKDGSYHFHEVVGINLLDDPAVKGVVVNSRDITERKHAEEELFRSTSEMRSIFQVLPDLYFRFSDDGTFLDCRAGSEEDLFVPLHEFMGRQVKDVLPSTVAKKIEQAIAEAIRTQAMVSIEYSLPLPEGEQVFEARLFPLWEGELMAIIRNITDRKRAEEQLITTTERLRALSARINRAREEERTNIAREIHDELGQLLTALRMDVFWLDKRLPHDEESVRKKLEEMVELIDVSIQTVRRIARELRPGVLDELGLAEALQWYLQGFHYRTDIEWSFTTSEEDMVVDHDRSTALFRIFQEALTNIARHAQATEVRVSLTRRAKIILLEIVDNGIGIAGDRVSDMESLGILGMKERAHIFRGEVAISGEKGKGTKVTVSMPLE